LLPWFKDNTQSLSIDPQDTAFPFLPGDILFMNTVGDGEPEHMGIVSDRAGRSGLPLVINNWNDGTKTAEMDLLVRVPVTHRFRMGKAMVVQPTDQGFDALLTRVQLSIPVASTQVIAVTTPLFESSGGTLTRWERVDAHFTQVGQAIPVRIGKAGLGQGRGLHRVRLTPKEKQEGDKRAPAGIFLLGTAFGRPAQRPYSGLWPYRAVTARDFWVDEPSTPDYNSWQTLKPGVAPPWSAEALSMYPLALVVDHNFPGPKPGAGSAIFLHPWKEPKIPTVGCTAMAPEDLIQILAWLDPKQTPVLVQLAGQIF
jgi:L,D-peptidoglycan transpeptidase YkuD (ErfK/YbiS/YcfS/YnhG family)